MSSSTAVAGVLMLLLAVSAAVDPAGAAAVDASTAATVVADATATVAADTATPVADTTAAAATPAASTNTAAETVEIADSNVGGLPQSVAFGLPSSEQPLVQQPQQPSTKNGDIYSFIIHSKIKYRYAQTVVSSRVANKGNTSHEIQFFVTLPESAFVSKFLMEVNEKTYEAYVKEKKEAHEDYIAAVNLGQTAAHVEQNARDSNKFTVSVNVEAESKVTFNLTYEQLLTRKLGTYENIINVQPGQVVKNLQVIVEIEESSNITTLEVPDIKTVNEIETTISKNKLAQISRESGNKTTITWSPTVKEQLTFTERGVKGQFIVQYDVDHESTPNQVLIDDGYFVHFFAPTDLKPLRTHVIFVLDVSGSMVGQKLPQLKEAMDQILSEMHPDDFFTLILFSDFAQIWTINATQETSNRWDDTDYAVKLNKTSVQALGENRFVFPATEQNIQYAKKFIQDLTSDSSTNMEDALNKAHAVAKLGETHFKNGSNTPKPIIVFLTDGEPTTGITEPHDLIRYVSNINKEKYPMFSLGFGDGADIDFLKKLSLNNTGFARVIYEASDASLQLRNFYKEISSPVLSNVTFKYADTQVDNITVTKKTFNLLFRGTELVVAGKLKDTKAEFNGALDADSSEGSFQGPIMVTCFDIPIVPPADVPQTRQIGHLEKLWAYLYIQQLMDQYELNKNENSTEKAKALELALKYSFVTPLTSLVVVKPNDTATSAGPEKIKPHNNDKYNFGSLMASGAGFQAGLPMANNVAASSYVSAVSLKSASNVGYILKGSSITPIAYSAPESMMFPVFDNSKGLTKPPVDYSTQKNTEDLVENEQFTTTDGSANVEQPHDISELTWLDVSNSTQPTVSLNTTNVAYQVLLNTTGQSYQNCTTPDSAPGVCKHLKDCVVASILNSFDMYIPLFCPVENIYAGICCLA